MTRRQPRTIVLACDSSFDPVTTQFGFAAMILHTRWDLPKMVLGCSAGPGEVSSATFEMVGLLRALKQLLLLEAEPSTYDLILATDCNATAAFLGSEQPGGLLGLTRDRDRLAVLQELFASISRFKTVEVKLATKQTPTAIESVLVMMCDRHATEARIGQVTEPPQPTWLPSRKGRRSRR